MIHYGHLLSDTAGSCLTSTSLWIDLKVAVVRHGPRHQLHLQERRLLPLVAFRVLTVASASRHRFRHGGGGTATCGSTQVQPPAALRSVGQEDLSHLRHAVCDPEHDPCHMRLAEYGHKDMSAESSRHLRLFRSDLFLLCCSLSLST